MPALSYKGAMSSGHTGFPPRPSSAGSPSVFVNGIAALRVGDAWPVHCNPSNVCHAGSQSSGSGTVFINGQPAGRIGDDISCGDSVAQGSTNVFVGG